jgi:hypothetical protein
MKNKRGEIILTARNDFYLKLLNQEVTMFHLLGGPVYLVDINWVCKRRGFNTKERVCLMRAVKKLKLWKEMK